MFLAEDRLLCLAIFTKEKCNYTLKYVPDAKAKTDPVGDLPTFIGQRKRWINGSFFALKYVLRNFSEHVSRSDHSCERLTGFWFNMGYSYLSMMLGYLSLSFYYTFL